jgi:hypothetical protein
MLHAAALGACFPLRPFAVLVVKRSAGCCFCRPDACLGKAGVAGETPLQTLIREALEFQDIYHM